MIMWKKNAIGYWKPSQRDKLTCGTWPPLNSSINERSNLHFLFDVTAKTTDRHWRQIIILRKVTVSNNTRNSMEPDFCIDCPDLSAFSPLLRNNGPKLRNNGPNPGNRGKNKKSGSIELCATLRRATGADLVFFRWMVEAGKKFSWNFWKKNVIFPIYFPIHCPKIV